MSETIALDDLLPQIYEELRVMARHLRSRYRTNDSIRATSIVHAAYVRLVKSDPDIKDPAHAAALAARAMRNVLIDRIRRRATQRRGGGLERVSLSGLGQPDDTVDLLAIDSALTELASVDPRGAEIVQLRFFGGLTTAEMASLHGVSTRTIERDWRAARAWLADRLSE